MTRRGSPVDFGPLSLPVGDTPFFQESHVGSASVQDVERLQALLSDSGRGGQDQDDSLVELPRATAAAMARDSMHLLSSLAEALPGLAASPAFKTQQHAEIQISRELLADTHLSVTDTGARIEFVLRVGGEADRDWLRQHLPWLAKTVGEKLERDVRIAVFDSVESGFSGAFEDWHVGMQA
jgi:hypothetical protein